MEIITRAEAKSQGLKRYFTGKPCNRGHLSERFISNTGCLACQYPQARSYHADNREAILNRQEQYRMENKEVIRQKGRTTYAKDPKFFLEKSARYAKDNPEKARYHASKRRAAKLERTPPWADLDAIKEFYLNCPSGCDVDHIIPLQGELVSGLHVRNNLQYLTAFENASKGNRINLDLYEGRVSPSLDGLFHRLLG